MSDNGKDDRRTASLPVIFACHAVTSSTLTLLNKRVAVSVTFPWLVVLLQCLGSSVICLLINIPFRSIRRIQPQHLPGAVLISCLFTLCLVSSICGLRRVHVPMAVVGKNLTPFVTAVLEAVLLRATLSASTVTALLIGTVGGGIYLFGDANATTQGFLYVILNAVCVAVTSIAEKHVTAKKQQSPLGLCFLRNALSIPFVSLFLLADLEATRQAWREFAGAGAELWTGMLVTSLFGAVTGMLLFTLQTLVTATTTQVAGLCYKLASTFLSFFCFPSSRSDVGLVAMLGYALSMASISLYMLSKK